MDRENTAVKEAERIVADMDEAFREQYAAGYEAGYEDGMEDGEEYGYDAGLVHGREESE